MFYVLWLLAPWFRLSTYGVDEPTLKVDNCTTPGGAMGLCLQIKQCPILLAILENRQRSPAQADMLKNSKCGNTSSKIVNVCCPSCVTPGKNRGICRTIDSCPHLKAMRDNPLPSSSTFIYLSKSECARENRDTACCGITPDEPEAALLPSSDMCGGVNSGDKILGGSETQIDDYPWMALVEYLTPSNTTVVGCAATLISARYALTAAHCVHERLLSQLGQPVNVRLGEYDTRTGVDCVEAPGGDDCNDGPLTIPIARWIPHQKYDPASGDEKNDIALLRLAFEAPYTYFIRPICLPTSDITKHTGAYVYVAGWGSTRTGISSSVKLQIEIPIVPFTQCLSAYMNVSKNNIPWRKQICAGGEDGKDSCQGDSGGPMMSMDGMRWVLHGVVSYGPIPCASPRIPGVYTKVFSYLEWIKKQISH